eukprot:3080738-Rhodomonas_salina.1
MERGVSLRKKREEHDNQTIAKFEGKTLHILVGFIQDGHEASAALNSQYAVCFVFRFQNACSAVQRNKPFVDAGLQSKMKQHKDLKKEAYQVEKALRKAQAKPLDKRMR